jgi:hypothetical protein
MNFLKYGFFAVVLLTCVKFGTCLKSMIPKTRIWATISQLFSGHGPSFVFMALKGRKCTLPAGFLNRFLCFRNTLKNCLAYRDSSSILQFLLHVCFAPEKNPLLGAFNKTYMVALVTL